MMPAAPLHSRELRLRFVPRLFRLSLAGPALLGFAGALTAAEPLTVTLTTPPPAESGYFKMGTSRNPAGREITLNSRSLLLDGKPWVPAMGEFHYSRYPANEWREELLKMKAGGIDIVATYVFWIHHEEIEGEWDWSGQRNLRAFVEAARDAGLYVIVRCGPWCHGEVRNGGLPEWLVQNREIRARSDDPLYLEKVRVLYGQIARQIQGLLWKDGGPIIGIQLENEYGGPAQHLLTLKSLARELGLDVPLYTRTGWPALRTEMPLGEIVPLYGVYAEGFWDREITPMPGRYWSGFHFSQLRTDANIANEILGRRDVQDAPDVARYPYLTCEIGGGMMNSYHRRILVDPRDVISTTLVKIGSGSTSPGYYMYHGGTNPEGKRTTLMEAQATAMTNWNDMPVKNYDFQAPLGQFGQIRPHYHALRRLHFFLDDYGSDLAGMPTVLPDQRPTGRDDATTLRWAVRANGQSGFVFFNNYERLKELPAKTEVQFALTLADGSKLTFPSQPVTIPTSAMGWWPFNLELHGVTFTYATTQPFSHILEENGTRTLFFAATPGVPAEFAFAARGLRQVESSASVERTADRFLVRNVPTGRGVAIRVVTDTGNTTQIVLLSEEDSLAFWKGPIAGRNRAVLTRTDVVFERDQIRLTATTETPIELSIFPAPTTLTLEGRSVAAADDGIFRRYSPSPATRRTTSPRVTFEQVRPAGPPREIKNGPIAQPVAQMPDDADFAAAAVWRVKLPADLDLSRRPILRFHYAGDVARATLNGHLLTDDYYNGCAFDLGVARFAPEIQRGELLFAVLPLRRDAPIYLADSARPKSGDAPAHASLREVELVEFETVTFTAR